MCGMQDVVGGLSQCVGDAGCGGRPESVCGGDAGRNGSRTALLWIVSSHSFPRLPPVLCRLPPVL